MIRSIHIDEDDGAVWHHASQLQAQIAQLADYLTRLTAKGWEVWATDLDFGSLVIQAGE